MVSDRSVLMLIVGMPLDLPPSILLLGPIFVPLAATIGFDPCNSASSW